MTAAEPQEVWVENDDLGSIQGTVMEIAVREGPDGVVEVVGVERPQRGALASASQYPGEPTVRARRVSGRLDDSAGAQRCCRGVG